MVKTTLNIDLKTIILVGVLVIIGFSGGFGWMKSQLNKTEKKLDTQINITAALTDSLTVTKNRLGEEVASKATLQITLDQLEDQNIVLNEVQHDLIERIKKLNKKNTVISAALVQSEIKIDSLLFASANTEVEIDTTNKIVTFKDSIMDKDNVITLFAFDVSINGVLPVKEIKPSIQFNNVKFENEQFIEFKWDDDSKYNQRPVSFSITNINPFVVTTGVESYIIPEVNKSVLQPTGWQKTKVFFKDRKSEFVIGLIAGGVGVLVGATKL